MARKNLNRTGKFDETALEKYRLQLTDIGNAQRFREYLKDKAIYVGERKGFYVWDGKRWAYDLGQKIVVLAQEFVLEEYGRRLSDKNMAPRDRAAAFKHLVKTESSRGIQAMLKLVEGLIAVSQLDLDTRPHLLNLQNGTLDLTTSQFREHRPSDLITMVCGVGYNAEAECPRWEQFMEEIFPEKPDTALFVQRLIGYSLQGEVLEAIFPIFYGRGRNGKTVLSEVLLHILGDYATVTPAKSLMARKSSSVPSNDLARLYGKRLVFASETNEGEKLDEAKIKEATGGDTLAVRFLYGEFFEYRPCYTIVLRTNHAPQVGGSDAGIWSRLRMIPFTESFEEDRADKNLMQNLIKAEAQGILNWIIEGLISYRSSGLPLSDDIRDATVEFKTDNDVLDEFCASQLITKDPGTRVFSSEVYHRYKQFCEWRNEAALSQRRFTRSMKDRGHVTVKSSGIIVFKGIRLRAWEESRKLYEVD